MSWEILAGKAAAVGAGRALEEANKRWGRVGRALMRKRARIAFTGQAGAGKTVLFEFLNGSAFSANYQIPRASVAKEKRKSTPKNRRLVLVTIPGDPNLASRNEAMASLFPTRPQRFWSRDKPVVGVVHVVSNGLPEVRLGSAERELVRQGYDSIERYQELQRGIEVEDLAQTLGFIERSHSATGFPKWLIVAVTKVDLYVDSLAEVEDYYTGAGQSLFAEQLDRFRDRIGTASMRVEVLPVCSRLENFTFNNEVLRPRLDESNRNRLVGELRDHILQLAEGLT